MKVEIGYKQHRSLRNGSSSHSSPACHVGGECQRSVGRKPHVLRVRIAGQPGFQWGWDLSSPVLNVKSLRWSNLFACLKQYVTKREIDSKRIALLSSIMRFKPDYVHPFMNIDVSVVPDSVLASERTNQVRSCFNTRSPISTLINSLYCYTLMSSGRLFIFLLVH